MVCIENRDFNYVKQMSYRPPLSGRRRLNITTTNFEPVINNFLREAIKFESPPNPPKDNENETKMQPRKLLRNGTMPKTSEELKAGRRRAFERAHEIQSQKLLKTSERQWKEEKRYNDWKSKKPNKKIERIRPSDDKHVIEDIVHLRNAYYLESIATGEQKTSKFTSLRKLPKEYRTKSQMTMPTYYWG